MKEKRGMWRSNDSINKYREKRESIQRKKNVRRKNRMKKRKRKETGYK
jgi:hypothetical protein